MSDENIKFCSFFLVPYQVVIGDREVANKTLAVRALESSETDAMSLDEFARRLQTEINQRGRKGGAKH